MLFSPFSLEKVNPFYEQQIQRRQNRHWTRKISTKSVAHSAELKVRPKTVKRFNQGSAMICLDLILAKCCFGRKI